MLYVVARELVEATAARAGAIQGREFEAEDEGLEEEEAAADGVAVEGRGPLDACGAVKEALPPFIRFLSIASFFVMNSRCNQ